MSTATETGKKGKKKDVVFEFNGSDLKRDIGEVIAELKKKIEEVIKEGSVHRVVIKDARGKELESVPLGAGLVGIVLSFALIPVIAAVGVACAIAASARYDLKIVIEREKVKTKKSSRSAKPQQPDSQTS